MKIFIGFSAPKKLNIFSNAIKLLFKTPFSHVYIRFHSTEFEESIVFQASNLFVNFMSFETFRKHNNITFELAIDIIEEKKTNFYRYMLESVGRPYSIAQALGLGLVRLVSVTGIRMKNPIRNNSNAYVCSELVGQVLQNYTSPLFSITDLDSISPLDLYEILKNYGENNIQIIQ